MEPFRAVFSRPAIRMCNKQDKHRKVLEDEPIPEKLFGIATKFDKEEEVARVYDL